MRLVSSCEATVFQRLDVGRFEKIDRITAPIAMLAVFGQLHGQMLNIYPHAGRRDDLTLGDDGQCDLHLLDQAVPPFLFPAADPQIEQHAARAVLMQPVAEIGAHRAELEPRAAFAALRRLAKTNRVFARFPLAKWWIALRMLSRLETGPKRRAFARLADGVSVFY